MSYPTASGILAAVDRIDPVFLDTPLLRSDVLDRQVGAAVTFKDETANPIRSFKGRGAGAFLASLDAPPPLICASAGNFGQGLAWAARSRELSLIVVASRGIVVAKREAMEKLGADVRLLGHDFDDAKRIARMMASGEGRLFVEDGAEIAIAEGAGTLALEMTERAGPFDAVLVPLGNGALASGVGTWMKHASPRCEVVLVAAERAPAMAESVRTGRLVETPEAPTIADGIAVRVPVPYAVDSVRRIADDVALVSEEAIRMAMALVKEHLGLVVEPAGVAGLAAMIADPERWRGRSVAIPLCGGNVDPPPGEASGLVTKEAGS
ncbi:threonine ammonia-lyase [Sphingomonas colocasiae]|uniref:Pyridoxal-phosphate dependent enzyme n=1 Tax=Sphingomonas colocasiae TaxID=1848973 RepID=A0ABS7PPE4_9SPHN|nr:pyridoxal-phosphate dependent enzyme [Sphingomonas colocasiae]MBY8822874.1 pyridoxal-phosphate dependent enzyme [Sphingomonas colocasiae]